MTIHRDSCLEFLDATFNTQPISSFYYRTNYPRESLGVKATLDNSRFSLVGCEYCAGCLYCQAHTANIVSKLDEDGLKMANPWEFETSDLFSEAERAALRFAMHAASVPNTVTDAVINDFRGHFSDDEIVELLACVSVMGFMSRWNDTLATTLEDQPLEAATKTIGHLGWVAGRHARHD